MSKDTIKKRVKTPIARPHIFIITAAQNNTGLHENTWATLQRMTKYYSQHYPTELKVIRSRYKNPTSRGESKKHDKEEWWDPKVIPHLLTEKCLLNSRLMVLGDMKVEWASKNPLQGLDALTKDKSGIVGHPNRALRSIATPQHKQPKVMFTTGACTVGTNYSDTKRGQVGAFNHCLGALIVEIHGDKFYARQLNADDHGCIIDLDMEFTPTGWRPAKRAMSLVTGDMHERWKRPDVIRATFDAKDSIMNLLRPRYLFYHDILDFHSRNHHHNDDCITKFGNWKFKGESVRDEIESVIRFLNTKTPDDCRGVVVSANHDRAVKRWLKEADFKNDPINAVFYLEAMLDVYRSVRKTGGGIAYNDPFISYARKRVKKNVRFLDQGESLVLGNVEHGLHGDLGPNGARGTTTNLSVIGVKVNKGHNHTAEIIGGCYSAGMSANAMEYEEGGPSSHSNAHIIQYANGKRAILFVVNGRYCLPRFVPSTKAA